MRTLNSVARRKQLTALLISRGRRLSLKGLRRLDEGLVPADAFPAGYVPRVEEQSADVVEKAPVTSRHEFHMPAFLSFRNKESAGKRKPLLVGAVVLAILASVGAMGVPAGWYSRTNVAVTTDQPSVPIPVAEPSATVAEKIETPEPAVVEPTSYSPKRQRDRDRARGREERAAALGNQTNVSSLQSVKAGPKKVAVTVSYDESGRVVQASGGDASALRIARQKRFPAGKAGSATVTIPVN